MNTFLKSTEVQLSNGGYLTTKTEQPIFNEDFVRLQKRAEFIIEFAKVAKTKNFAGKKADSLDDTKLEVWSKLNKAESVNYVTIESAPKNELTIKLQKEAMAFMTFKQDSSVTEKLNDALQEFNKLKEFETFGLFFTEEIVKLNKIYTVTEVVEAYKSCIELL